MPASLYSDGSGVGRKFPVITRQALLSSALIYFAWQDFPQTAQQYSAVEYDSASAVVLSVLGSAPQLELASFARMLFLVDTFPFTFLACSEKVSVLSRVTPR